MWLGGYDLTRGLDAVNLQATRVPIPMTASGDDLEVFYPGPQVVDAVLAGFWSAGAGEPDAVVGPRIFTTPDVTEWPLTILPPRAPNILAGADGNAAYNLRSAQYGIREGGSHGESLPFYLGNRARTGRLDRITVVLPKATYAATTTGTSWQLGRVSSSQKMVCVLHVFAVTGGTWTLTVESDVATGFPTATVQKTFTAATGITRQVLEVSGPVLDDWWRVVLTKAGGTSCVAAALLGVTPI